MKKIKWKGWEKKCWNCSKDAKLLDVDTKKVKRFTCIDCEVIIRNGEVKQ